MDERPRTGGLDRKLRRRLDRLNQKDGDHCHGCRRAFENHDICTYGYDAAGRLLGVGECCRGRLVSTVAGSIYFSASSAMISEVVRQRQTGRRVQLGAATPWSEDDRAWFVAHPKRSHRLRRAFPGEWPREEEPNVQCNHTVVRQAGPGERLRLPVFVSELLPQKGEAPEAAAWAIFDLTTEARQKGEKTVTVEAILARWAQLETEGRA